LAHLSTFSAAGGSPVSPVRRREKRFNRQGAKAAKGFSLQEIVLLCALCVSAVRFSPVAPQPALLPGIGSWIMVCESRGADMWNLSSIAGQVAGNCNVSDAQSAGLYSICGLALRLRDLFKWEKGLMPWEEPDPAVILEWIGDREELWEKIVEEPLAPLRVDGIRLDPFDTEAINRNLVPEGFYYGAGYAQSMKPTFFLAEIEDCCTVDGVPVFTLGRELARDLLTLPALSQNGQVLLRTEAARLYLWDQMFYIKKSGRTALACALRACGLPDPRPETIRCRLDDVFEAARPVYVYHEIGEVKNRVFDRKTWQEIVYAFAHSPVELLARTLKDLLADTDPAGTLPKLIEERRSAAVGFYAAFFDGLARAMLPGLRPAHARFVQDGDWVAFGRYVAEARDGIRRRTEAFLDIVAEGKSRGDPEWTRRNVACRILDPLTSQGEPIDDSAL
jgi:hypothetical protein